MNLFSKHEIVLSFHFDFYMFEKKNREINTIYPFQANLLSGESIDFSQYRGKIVLIVNTASNCGFTPQFKALESLYKKYKDKGFVILGFPCNQFMHQEPEDNKSIAQGCVLYYGVTFPMFEKIDVNGALAHPLYVFLKKELPGFLYSAIKWNFTKFLINREGIPIKRYGSIVKPNAIENDIVQLLNNQ